MLSLNFLVNFIPRAAEVQYSSASFMFVMEDVFVDWHVNLSHKRGIICNKYFLKLIESVRATISLLGTAVVSRREIFSRRLQRMVFPINFNLH